MKEKEITSMSDIETDIVLAAYLLCDQLIEARADYRSYNKKSQQATGLFRNTIKGILKNKNEWIEISSAYRQTVRRSYGSTGASNS